MTSRFLWASLLLIFLTVLSACAPEADKNVPEENAAELSEPATPEEEAGPDPEAPDSEETLRALAEAFSLEEKLSLFMTPYTSIELDTFRYGDFDRDGVHEAFAVKHIDNHDLRFERLGVLIFIRPDGCTVLEMLEQTGYRSFKHGALADREFFLFGGTGANYIYMVKDSRAVRLANPAQKLAALVSPSERFVYGDFDGDGSGEAFALLYDKGSLRDSYDTYFFNEESYEELSGPSISVSLSYPWKLDGKELVYDGVAGYSVKDSRVVQVFSWPYELNRAGDSDSQFTVTVKADDAVTMAKDGTNSGSTSKQYWLYWNGERFAEYGGRPLTKEQLAAFTGGADLLHSLDYNGDVGSIYYRDNGIITVNYRPWAGTTEQQDNFFRILSCAGDVLTDVTEEMTKDWPSQNRGTYLSSAFLLSYMGFGDPLSSNVYDIQFASRLPIDVRYDLAAAAPEALKNVATLPVHGMLSILNEGDFDGDGQYELFAVLYPYVLLDPYNHYDGRCIYLFLHADGCTILGNSEFASFSHYVLDATDLFCFTEYHLTAGGLGTHVYTVANSRAVQIAVTGPALTRIGDTNQFYTTTPKIYDATDSGVFTFKDYWLFWDGGRLREYGGLRVSEEQLSRFAYGQAVLDSIKNEGNTIDEIYYRGNGVININYSRREEYNYRYGYKNLLYRDGNITDDTENWLKKEGGGRYLASYLDYSISSERFGVDTAYPASFP